MICKKCRGKSIVRGIKHVICLSCSKQIMVNYAFTNICEDCSNELQKCQCCGEVFKRRII
jgi:predicted amidophosphoribosyltransferase